MPYYDNEQVEKAREMDLLTYLRLSDSGDLVKVSGENYSTRSHDSMSISNGKWMWWSRGFGGASALDYLVKVRGHPFTEAVGMILNAEGSSPPFLVQKKEDKKVKKLLLPEKNSTNDQVIRYLTDRGIDRGLVERCIEKGLIYESVPHRNCIFLGFDESGTARYASFRATKPARIMGDAAGSNKRYSFRIEGKGREVHVFESAIDLKYWSIVPPGWNKSIRTYRLGEEYTKDRIMERVYGNDPSVRTERIRQAHKTPNNYNLKRRIDKIMGRTGLEKLYLRYCYELGYLPKYTQRPTKLHIVLKEDILKCDMYSEEAKFLVRNKIETDVDLGSFVAGTKDTVEKLTGEREELRKKVKRNISEPDREAAKEKIKELTEKLKVCRKDLRLAGDIGERSNGMEKNLETVDRERTEVRERKGVKSI